MSSIKLDELVIVDIESTCWEPKPAIRTREYESEIIEIGIAVLDLKGQKPITKESVLVKPQYSKVSPFCTQLTTLTQEQVNRGCSFFAACEGIRAKYQTQNRVWASYGDYDRKQFQMECDSKKVKYPFGPRHINIKNLFAVLHRLPKEVGMPEALTMLGLELTGTHHRGADDAYNIALIASKIL